MALKEAYEWLQKAIDAGWIDHREARIEPELETLRPEERFKQMMAQVQARCEEMRRRLLEQATSEDKIFPRNLRKRVKKFPLRKHG